MAKYFAWTDNTLAAERAAFSPSKEAVDVGLAATFRQEEERRLVESAPAGSVQTEDVVPTSGGASDPIDLGGESAEARVSSPKKKRSSSSQRLSGSSKPSSSQKPSKKRKVEEGHRTSSGAPHEGSVRGKEVVRNEEDDMKKKFRLNLTRIAKAGKFFQSIREGFFSQDDQLKEALEEKKTLESDMATSSNKTEQLSARLEEREMELTLARSEIATKEELLMIKEQYAMEKQSAFMAMEVENRRLKEELEKEKGARAEGEKVKWEEGFYQFPYSSEMELFVAEFRERLLSRLWNSTLSLQGSSNGPSLFL